VKSGERSVAGVEQLEPKDLSIFNNWLMGYDLKAEDSEGAHINI
jgi:hypothetical protein